MSEKKKEIVTTLGKELPKMTEKQKIYLMGYLEGYSAGTGAEKLAAVGKGV